MRDPAIRLQTKYFDLLSGQISYGGKVVPVYDNVPANAVYPYIQIGTKTDTLRSTKTYFGNEITQGLTVVTRFDASSTGSRLPMYAIADDIMQIICARPVSLINIVELNVITSTLDNSVTRTELTTTHKYMIYELRFRHIIEQLVAIFDETFDPTFL